MPNFKKNPSAEKRVRQAIKRRAKNRIVRGQMRRLMRSYRAETNLEKLIELQPAVASAIDKAAKKGVIHNNTAARYKSRLSKYAVSIKNQQESK